MYFKQITTPGLGCFSYILGCPEAGIMAVVDPRRDISEYLALSHQTGMSITHIFETHIHADYVSGAQELRRATGADIYIHQSAPVEYQTEKLAHGNEFTLGDVFIRVLHTPGPTPDSVCYLISDLSRSPEPEMLLTGDLLFVGGIGSPDIPEETVSDTHIRPLYESLYTVLKGLPDGLEIYPAHGQGSLHASGLSAKPMSTLGYERIANPRMRCQDYAEFKKIVLSELPVRPRSFANITALNLKGAPLLQSRESSGNPLMPREIAHLLQKGVKVLDLRNSMAFCAVHIPGSLHVDFSAPHAITWVGAITRPGAPLILILEKDEDFANVLTQFRSIGCDDVVGYLRGGIQAWIDRGQDLESLPMLFVPEFKQRLENPNPPLLIDVRTPKEYAQSSLDNSINLPVEALLAGSPHPSEPGNGKVVIGQSRYRATIAAALLQANGCKHLSVLSGGIAAVLAAQVRG